MSKEEMQGIGRQMLNVYRGILFHNQEFEGGNREENIFEFHCPEFTRLRQKYDLPAMAGTGSDFHRAKALMGYFAPRLTHAPWYDNHIPCNALELLAYSLDNPEQGINCLNKAKILVESCLSLGIYARRVRILPYSPYDFDNHVVAEIYDRERGTWILLDPSADGYFVDEEKTPLSLWEIRHRFATGKFVTFVSSGDSLEDLPGLAEKHLSTNLYICKNLFYFQVEQYATFGEKGKFLYFVPRNYAVKETNRANLQYRMDNLPQSQESFRKTLAKRAEDLMKTPEPPRTDLHSLLKKPV